ncbi:MAG: glycosyltransferase, partial [Flavobacteriaceae bacterium]|nr:glycosyltransferase [Flavobacteriaceae bacterium]
FQVDRTKKTLMVAILGSSDIKTYPLKYMSKLIDFIVEYADVNVLFNYIPSQSKEAQQVYAGCKASTQKVIFFDLIGKSLREYIALMNECDIIMGNDGGAINMAKALNKPSFIIFSPWIRQEMWSTFEDGDFHKSVHLTQFKPELFESKSEKELKKNSLELYRYFKPEFIYSELRSFLDFNLNNEKVLHLKSLIKPLAIPDIKRVSAIIITKNEATNLASLIRNLQFANEIIIVDSYSQDDTKNIIKKYPEVTLVEQEFSNYSDQRNFAIDQAQNNWILFIDADERIPKSLQFEIRKALSSKGEIVAYEMYRQFYFQDTPLKYGGFQTDKVVRLFDKRKARYDSSKLVHETLTVDGRIGGLKSKLLHFSFNDEQSYKQKLISYAKLRAKELQAKNSRATAYHLYIKPWYRFIYHYLVRRGFLDGRPGLTMAKLNAFGVKQRFIELKKLKLNQR